MTRLTSVYGSFRARVMAARLEDEGFDVELRGALDSPYALTIGDFARVDVYVPDDQVEDACIVLLATEVDEVDDVLDDDRPPPGYGPRHRARWIAAFAILLILIAGPVATVVRWL
jgi:hypothetical protein